MTEPSLPTPVPRRCTMAMLAQMAGVSKTVISVVLNARTTSNVRVSAATRDRILALIRKHHYVPSKAARDLVTRRTHTIGLPPGGATTI